MEGADGANDSFNEYCESSSTTNNIAGYGAVVLLSCCGEPPRQIAQSKLNQSTGQVRGLPFDSWPPERGAGLRMVGHTTRRQFARRVRC